MKRTRRLVAMAAFALISIGASSLRAQLLWPGTAAGMSVEAVRQAFPEARAPEENAAVQLPNGRGVELLTLDQTVIAGHTFRARFFFNREQQLVVVVLADSGETPAKEFEKFRDLLRAKYGMEQSTRSAEYVQVVWKAVQTTIQLTWYPQGRSGTTMSISYEAPIPNETNRL